ncbi:MAG: ribosome maturation factor RimM [Actinomycetota bacterium]
MEEPTVVVGEITKVHGLTGEVLVKVYSEVPERFAPGATVYLQDGPELTVAATRNDRGRLLVTFREIADRSAAERVRGRALLIPESWLPELAEGRWWPHELVGCNVVTEGGRSLGAVADVVENPANDLWVAVDDDGTETLVPALRDVVVEVDVAGRRIVVRDIPGLTVPEETAQD